MEENEKNDGGVKKKDLFDADENEELRALGIDPVLANKAGEAYERVIAALQQEEDPSTEDMELVNSVMKRFPEDQPSPQEKELQNAIDMMMKEDLRTSMLELQKLLASLPPNFSSFSHFAGIKRVPEAMRDYLLQKEDVRAMGVAGESLASVGMYPLHLMETIHAMELLANRIANPYNKSPHLQTDGSIRISRELMFAQVRSDSINPEAFEPLGRWMLDLLRIRPTLIDGFHVGIVTDAEIILRPIVGPNK